MFADYFGFEHETKRLKQQLRWRIRKEGIQTRLDAPSPEPFDDEES